MQQIADGMIRFGRVAKGNAAFTVFSKGWVREPPFRSKSTFTPAFGISTASTGTSGFWSGHRPITRINPSAFSTSHPSSQFPIGNKKGDWPQWASPLSLVAGKGYTATGSGAPIFSNFSLPLSPSLSTTIVSPERYSPESNRSDNGSCTSRWIERRIGLAP
jgi:hypothetical protein